MNNLILTYLFTDRANRSVYSISTSIEEDPIGQLRMEFGVDGEAIVDWSESCENYRDGDFN